MYIVRWPQIPSSLMVWWYSSVRTYCCMSNVRTSFWRCRLISGHVAVCSISEHLPEEPTSGHTPWWCIQISEHFAVPSIFNVWTSVLSEDPLLWISLWTIHFPHVYIYISEVPSERLWRFHVPTYLARFNVQTYLWSLIIGRQHVRSWGVPVVITMCSEKAERHPLTQTLTLTLTL